MRQLRFLKTHNFIIENATVVFQPFVNSDINLRLDTRAIRINRNTNYRRKFRFNHFLTAHHNKHAKPFRIA